jgi:hypothetical protein
MLPEARRDKQQEADEDSRGNCDWCNDIVCMLYLLLVQLHNAQVEV